MSNSIQVRLRKYFDLQINNIDKGKDKYKWVSKESTVATCNVKGSAKK